MKDQRRVAFIGAGSMAESILAGLLLHNKVSPENIFVTNRQDEARLTELKEKYGVQVDLIKESLLAEADIVILAMKPKGVKEAVESIRPFTNEKQLFLSVLAGITTEYISYLLDHNAPIIRVMPNTSSAVGSSATVIAQGRTVTEEHMDVAQSLLEAVGIVRRVKEVDLDAITAIAGSGPAYIYYLIEALQKSAEELLLDRELATDLILQMVQGSVDLLTKTGEDPRALYENVISPGGTTEAGFKVLKESQFQSIVIECIKNAAIRSSDISKQISGVPL
ncbi:pyrroline-5-carboxylate reductase [Guptibacillus hwajinpoensis]|uniref:Pyrroline-5-carboxylate reductase n=1 Tax=Guptibacillus hwajinpoensis TaxID=208199 RepID=A0ABU0JXM0_9BACL|nr:pyrroline-5-carboxylate reductase [Alkalihalobacillus hemicentroti]MDQ0481835.1 pyrroline-5-carboxylate reductase [Alkalihalobacillus hemicentroti]